MDNQKLAQVLELMKYRRISNEFDAAMEMLRPDISTSKKITIGADGKSSIINTQYQELASKSLATANFPKDDPLTDFVDEASYIALSIQNIVESSEGLLPLIEAHNFFAGLAGIKTQLSKGIEGKGAELMRTSISESRVKSTHSSYENSGKKTKALPTGDIYR